MTDAGLPRPAARLEADAPTDDGLQHKKREYSAE